MEPQAEATPPRHCDVLVIGGGPAGSTVAPLLAEMGYQVVLLDKARHPRFHIGESLLPANLPLFERLGVADEVRAIGMQKWGAEFVSPHHDHKQAFHFAEAWDKSMPYAYQVKRAEFDTVLIRNAARKGVAVHEGCKVRAVDFLPDGGAGSCRARRRARGRMAGALRRRCLRPRHLPRQPLPDQAAQPAPQQFGGLWPLRRRPAQRGPGGRQHHHLLVRARLVLVHPDAGRRHQRRHGDLAVLHEDPRRAQPRAVPRRRHRALPGASPSACGAPNWSTKSRRPAISPMFPSATTAPITCCSAMPTPSSTRSSRPASGWR